MLAKCARCVLPVGQLLGQSACSIIHVADLLINLDLDLCGICRGGLHC